jgi:hypothetical protein
MQLRNADGWAWVNPDAVALGAGLCVHSQAQSTPLVAGCALDAGLTYRR